MTQVQNSKNVAHALVKLTRPQNSLFSSLLASSISYLVTNNFIISIACYVLIYALYSLAAVYNNFIDVEVDTINSRTDNPLVSSNISKVYTMIFIIVLIGVVFITQIYLIQPVSILLTFVCIILLISYSNRRLNIQSRGIFATILLAICYGGMPALLGYFQGELDKGIIVFLLSSLVMIPIILAKDYKDIKGDRIVGKRTPLIIYGERVVQALAIFISVVFILLYFLYGVMYINTIIILLAIPLTVYFLYGVYRLHYDRGAIGLIHHRLLQTTIVGLLVIIV